MLEEKHASNTIKTALLFRRAVVTDLVWGNIYQSELFSANFASLDRKNLLNRCRLPMSMKH